MSTPFLSKLKSFTRAWLSLDLRSLALWRICLGSIVLLDLLIRLTDLTAHYTDQGICPRKAMIEIYPQAGWSLHMASGDLSFQLLLFSLHAVCALALVLGYRTFWATLATWFFLVSLHHRNLAVFDCGDFYLRMLLLWGLFLPLGKRWSLDALAAPGQDPADNRWFGVGAIAYPAQVTFVYLFAAYWKMKDGCWTETYTATYVALSLLTFSTPRAAWLLDKPEWMQAFTLLTLRFELYGPILLWMPGLSRLIAIMGVFLMHLGFGSFLHLGIFPLTGMVCTFGMLPGFVWDHIPGRLSRFSSSVGRLGRWLAQRLPQRRSPEHLGRGWGSILVCLVILVRVFVGNVQNLRIGYDEEWRGIDRALGLDQCWNMFAPHPPYSDGWYVIDAARCDGSHFDLFATLFGEHEDLTWAKPRFVASTFPNARWRKYMEYIHSDAPWRPYYCAYLTRLWNKHHEEQNEKIFSFDLYFMEVATPPYGQPRGRPQKKLLWSYQCFEVPVALPSGKLMGREQPSGPRQSYLRRSDY